VSRRPLGVAGGSGHDFERENTPAARPTIPTAKYDSRSTRETNSVIAVSARPHTCHYGEEAAR
jgi:hypothetical protein